MVRIIRTSVAQFYPSDALTPTGLPKRIVEACRIPILRFSREMHENSFAAWTSVARG
jgi:hypothetical protein